MAKVYFSGESNAYVEYPTTAYYDEWYNYTIVCPANTISGGRKSWDHRWDYSEDTWYTSEFRVQTFWDTESSHTLRWIISDEKDDYVYNGIAKHRIEVDGLGSVDFTVSIRPVNTAPSTPSNITVPTLIAGKTANISWGRATDPDGDAITYLLERNHNGSSWTLIYSGSSLSYKDTIDNTWNTVMYRVRAKDPSNAYSLYVASQWVTVVHNVAPTVPGAITVPDPVMGGQALTITWSKSTDEDGNLAGYELERKWGSESSYVQIYKGSELRYQDTIPKGTYASVTYRVRAYDTQNAYSSYRTSSNKTIINNAPPVISGTDTNLGTYAMDKPAYSYTVTDADGDTVTVTEALDGNTLRTYTPTLGASNSFELSDETWLSVLNGDHEITISANDGKISGGGVTRRLLFTKRVDLICFYLNPPLESSDMATKSVENIIRQVPDGAACKFEVCNNAFDASPTWEDVTQRILSGQKIFLANTTKTAAKWGYSVRVTIDRNGTSGDCWCSGGSGFFE